MPDTRPRPIPHGRAPVLAACDLDRTLIYSKNALWLPGPDKDAPALVVAEVYDGAPLSFMTRAAEDLLLKLSAAAAFVPVTTRTQAQYERVQLPGPAPEYAITTNGGKLLHRGVPDPGWRRHLAARIAADCAPLESVEARLAGPAHAGWILRVHRAEDLFVYAIVDRGAMPAAFLEQLQAECAAAGWTVSLQGRKLYCVPAPVTKGGALDEVARRTGAGTILAAGDSLLDADLLARADVAFRPLHGELHDAGHQAPNLFPTTVRGVLAGEEILARMLALAEAAG
ncbi:HAD family hydrolase [Arthrobacter sp. STN4]|uniref:HAD family hydrolase n=1 Tax=Arthrobacter sp. STN4 TaxID=2923276 RepID=UPI002119D4A7|nr:HAD family hydrolase [Arthrobacter sp. STN4]MCQ9162466.1 HAD family hydrolase [Arthrobacter sp. STN4]